MNELTPLDHMEKKVKISSPKNFNSSNKYICTNGVYQRSVQSTYKAVIHNQIHVMFFKGQCFPLQNLLTKIPTRFAGT